MKNVVKIIGRGVVIGKSSQGKARAEKLTPARRSEIAKKAAQARWSKKSDKGLDKNPIRVIIIGMRGLLRSTGNLPVYKENWSDRVLGSPHPYVYRITP